MKKRGQAQIITTVLIILLVLATIVIIWNVINRTVSESSKDVDIEPFTTQIGVEGVEVDANQITVKVKKGTGKGDITELRFIFYNKDGTNKIISNKETDKFPDALETKTFTFTELGPEPYKLPYSINEIIRVSVVPVFGEKIGIEVKGPNLGEGSSGTECTDNDIDGYNDKVCGGDDCDDNNFNVNPGATEVCDDNKDNDCDNLFDCDDSDCISNDYCTLIISPNLVSWWEFKDDKTSGETTPDSIGDNDGILYNGAYISGGELVLDGDGDYVDVGNDPSITGPFAKQTIMAWVNPNDVNGFKIFGPSSNTYYLHINENKFGYNTYGGGSWKKVLSTTTPQINKWHHVTGVYDGNDVKIYVDGYERNSVSNSVNIGSSTSNVKIGDFGGGGVTRYYFDGSIDDVMIFDRALSETEIQTIFNRQDKGDNRCTESETDCLDGIDNDCDGDTDGLDYDCVIESDKLISWWKFDEGSGTTVSDSGTGGNPGTVIGASWVTDSKKGNVLYFDSNEDYVNVNDHMSLKPQELTVSAWVYHIGTPTFWDYVITKHQGLEYDRGYQIVFAGDTTIRWGIFNGIKGDFVTNTFPLNEWHLVTGTADLTTVSIYYDGVFQSSTPRTIGNIDYTSAYKNLNIGSYYAPPRVGTLNGRVDDVMIFNTALTASQISNMYNNQKKN